MLDYDLPIYYPWEEEQVDLQHSPIEFERLVFEHISKKQDETMRDVQILRMYSPLCTSTIGKFTYTYVSLNFYRSWYDLEDLMSRMYEGHRAFLANSDVMLPSYEEKHHQEYGRQFPLMTLKEP